MIDLAKIESEALALKASGADDATAEKLLALCARVRELEGELSRVYARDQNAMAVKMLKRSWARFCDADTIEDDIDFFLEALEGAGLIELDAVTADDLDCAFAWERGIEAGGYVWRLTPDGRKALGEV